MIPIGTCCTLLQTCGQYLSAVIQLYIQGRRSSLEMQTPLF